MGSNSSAAAVRVRGSGMALGWPGGRGFLLVPPNKENESRHAVSGHFWCPMAEEENAGRAKLEGDGDEGGGGGDAAAAAAAAAANAGGDGIDLAVLSLTRAVELAGCAEDDKKNSFNAADRGCHRGRTLLLALARLLASVTNVLLDTFKPSAQ